MKAAIARMPGLTRLLGRRTMATIVAMKGTTTPARLAPFSILDIAGISVLGAGGAFGIAAICPIGSKLRLPGRYILASEPSSVPRTYKTDAKNLIKKATRSHRRSLARAARPGRRPD